MVVQFGFGFFVSFLCWPSSVLVFCSLNYLGGYGGAGAVLCAVSTCLLSAECSLQVI